MQLLDFDDDDDITAEFELYRTTPFADGKVVATSVLDSLMSAVCTDCVERFNSVYSLVVILYHGTQG